MVISKGSFVLGYCPNNMYSSQLGKVAVTRSIDHLFPCNKIEKKPCSFISILNLKDENSMLFDYGWEKHNKYNNKTVLIFVICTAFTHSLTNLTNRKEEIGEICRDLT